jgi:hypothetical protein
MLCLVRAQKFFCIMGSPNRYGLLAKSDQLHLPIANDPTIFDRPLNHRFGRHV